MSNYPIRVAVCYNANYVSSSVLPHMLLIATRGKKLETTQIITIYRIPAVQTSFVVYHNIANLEHC